VVGHLDPVNRSKFGEKQSFSLLLEVSKVEKASTAVDRFDDNRTVVDPEGGGGQLEGSQHGQGPLAIAGYDSAFVGDSKEVPGCGADWGGVWHQKAADLELTKDGQHSSAVIEVIVAQNECIDAPNSSLPEGVQNLGFSWSSIDQYSCISGNFYKAGVALADIKMGTF